MENTNYKLPEQKHQNKWKEMAPDKMDIIEETKEDFRKAFKFASSEGFWDYSPSTNQE